MRETSRRRKREKRKKRKNAIEDTVQYIFKIVFSPRRRESN